MDEALGVDPTKRVIAETELAGVVGDDDGLSEQAFGLDRPPQRRLARRPHRIGRHPEIGDAERAQVLNPWLARAERERSMAGELVDDFLRQISAAHIGDRRRIDHIARRPAEQTRKESQARFPRPGAERGEPIGADVGGETALAGMARAGVVDGDEGRPASPARKTASSSARKSSSLAVISRTTWRLEIASPKPARSATILSQVIWP